MYFDRRGGGGHFFSVRPYARNAKSHENAPFSFTDGPLDPPVGPGGPQKNQSEICNLWNGVGAPSPA